MRKHEGLKKFVIDTHSRIGSGQRADVSHDEWQKGRHESSVSQNFIGDDILRALPRQSQNLVGTLDDRRCHSQSALSRLQFGYGFASLGTLRVLRVGVVENVRYLSTSLRRTVETQRAHGVSKIRSIRPADDIQSTITVIRSSTVISQSYSVLDVLLYRDWLAEL